MSLDLFQLVDKYGFKGLVLVLIIVGVGGIIKTKWIGDILTKAGNSIINWVFNRKPKSDESSHISNSNILNHDLFNYIDFWMYSKVPTLQFSTEYRTIVFRKYLTVYLRCYKRGIFEFVNSGSYKAMDQSELWKNLLALINTIVSDYEKECDDIGIPKVIIQKMKLKNNDMIQLTIDLIENVSTSQFYQSENNLLKIYSILNIILSILENAIANSESVCNSINGQLRGMSMDGKTEP